MKHRTKDSAPMRNLKGRLPIDRAFAPLREIISRRTKKNSHAEAPRRRDGSNLEDAKCFCLPQPLSSE